jgi:hypothetical protein
MMPTTLTHFFSRLAILAACGLPLVAQTIVNTDLARLLASEEGREDAIAFVSASPNDRIPLLLELTKRSGADADGHDLLVGLADAFGKLKVERAIPFLLKNLTLPRDQFIDLKPWMKTDYVIVQAFPSIAAMISIGPDASRAIMHAYGQAMTNEDRLASIFVVAHIPGVPEAKIFLRRVSLQASQERFFAQEGLTRLSQ